MNALFRWVKELLPLYQVSRNKEYELYQRLEFSLGIKKETHSSKTLASFKIHDI